LLKVFRELWHSMPRGARRFILYEALSTPILFVWILVPYLMLVTGLSVLEAGAVLTLANGVGAALSYIAGRAFEKRSVIKVISLIGILEGLAYAIYFAGFWLRSVAILVAAASLERLTRGLYPAFSIYVYDSFPAEARSRAFTLRNLAVFSVQAATYPFIGLTLSTLGLSACIESLIAFSAASLALGLATPLILPPPHPPSVLSGRSAWLCCVESSH